MPILEVQKLRKSFDKNTPVLRGIDFSLEKGESAAIIGSSGSGINPVTMYSAPIQNRKKAQVRGIQPAAGIKTVFLFLFAAFIVTSFGVSRLCASASRIYVYVRRG